MASYEEAVEAFNQAVASGDIERADAIGQRITAAGYELPTESPPKVQAGEPSTVEAAPLDKSGMVPPPPAVDPSIASAFGRGIVQGGTFGFGDELQGVMGAGLDWMTGLTDQQNQLANEWGGQQAEPSDNYRTIRDDERRQNAQAGRDHPYAYAGGEFAGGMAVPGLGAYKGAHAISKVAPRVAPAGGLAISGGLEGAVAGAGYTEEEDPYGIAGDSGIGAAVGAVGAPIMGAAMNYLGRGAANVAGGINRRLFPDPQEQAKFRVKQGLESEGLTDLPSIRGALDELGPEGRLADVGPVLQREAVTSSKVQGKGSREARDFVDKRQYGQEARLGESARRELDPQWESFRGYIRDLEDQGSKQAKQFYDEAYKVDISPTPALGKISQTPYFQKAARAAQENITNKLDLYNGDTGVRGDGKIGTNLIDQIGRELRDMAESAYRSGNKEAAMDIRKIRTAMLDEVKLQNPALGKAMNVWRGKAALNDAAEYGRDLLTGRRIRLDELEEAMSDWSRSENESFRIGLLQGVYDKLEDASTNQNSAARLVNSSRVEKLLSEAFQGRHGARGDFDSFMRTVNGERAMQETRNRIVGGSPTFELTQSSRRGAEMTEPRGILGTIQNVVRWIGRETGDELTPEDHQEIVKLLFKDLSDEDIEGILRPTLRSRMHATGAGGPMSSAVGTSASQSIIGDDIPNMFFGE